MKKLKNSHEKSYLPKIFAYSNKSLHIRYDVSPSLFVL
jgi:hypothetical protein